MGLARKNGQKSSLSDSISRLSKLTFLYRLIEPFQKGETPTFTNHVKAGLEALASDPSSLLVFSG